MTTFQTRALSAAVFGIVMMVGLFWNQVSFISLFFIISTGCLWEFLKLNLEPNILRRNLYFIVGVCLNLLLTFLIVFWSSFMSWNLNVAIGWAGPISHTIYLLRPKLPIITIFPFLFLIVELFLKGEKPFQNIAAFLFGAVYTLIPFSLLQTFILSSNIGYSLEDSFNGYSGFTPNIVAGMLFLTWANDSFAYIIGSRIGKTPLFPRISPKKTWEGTIGGGLMCMVTAGIIGLFFKELSTINWVVIGGIVAVFGTLGDLVESMLKRSVGVKDSGSIMPGHGGFLDRFDAFMFVIPFVYTYLLFVR
jgi:phosphatidate cytidylyltransferase